MKVLQGLFQKGDIVFSLPFVDGILTFTVRNMLFFVWVFLFFVGYMLCFKGYKLFALGLILLETGGIGLISLGILPKVTGDPYMQMILWVIITFVAACIGYFCYEQFFFPLRERGISKKLKALQFCYTPLIGAGLMTAIAYTFIYQNNLVIGIGGCLCILGIFRQYKHKDDRIRFYSYEDIVKRPKKIALGNEQVRK